MLGAGPSKSSICPAGVAKGCAFLAHLPKRVRISHTSPCLALTVREGMSMTKQESAEYEALWTWFKALDAATDAAHERIHATLPSNRAEGARSAAPASMPRRLGEERKAIWGEWAAACL